MKWKEVLEVVGLVAILSGMYFVYAEIKQNGTIARAELSSDSLQRMGELRDKLLDPEFSALYQKGFKSPSDLSESERDVLSGFFRSLIWVLYFEYQNYNLGIFAEYDQMARTVTRQYFASGYGRAYWRAVENRIGADIAAVVNEELSKIDAGGNLPVSDLEILQEIDAL